MGGVCSATIESQNVVGYAGKTIGTDNNFETVPFATIGCNTADIQTIKLASDEASVGWGEELFSIWTGVPTVVAGSEFTYWDASMDPEGLATECYWGDDSCARVNYSVPMGQAVAINCVNEGISVTTSGQVPTEDVSFEAVTDNNFTGNPFPASIDIQNIVISSETASVGWGEELFSIWEGVPTVAAGSEFTYWDASMDPEGLATECYWGDDACAKATYSIEPGQGVVINCVNEGLTITIKAPYSL